MSHLQLDPNLKVNQKILGHCKIYFIFCISIQCYKDMVVALKFVPFSWPNMAAFLQYMWTKKVYWNFIFPWLTFSTTLYLNAPFESNKIYFDCFGQKMKIYWICSEIFIPWIGWKGLKRREIIPFGLDFPPCIASFQLKMGWIHPLFWVAHGWLKNVPACICTALGKPKFSI